MTNLQEIFNTEDTQNWFAACLATKCCREGLLDLIGTIGTCLQTQVIQNAITSNNLPPGTVCVSCPTSGVIPCFTKGVCKIVNKQCTFHKTPPRPSCPNKLCDGMVKEIRDCHRYKGPSWRNTNADQWTSNPFEILKCFMPVEGYIDKQSAESTDFNGLINVAINCKLFENYFSSNLTREPNVCSEARAVTRDLRHNAGFKLDKVQLHSVYDALLALLSDSKFLLHDTKAQDAFKNISELKAGKLAVTAVDINAVLADMNDCRADIIEQMTEKVKEAVKNISHTTDEKVKEAEGKISHTTDEKVKEAEGKISHTTDEKVKEAEGKISHTTDEKVKEGEGKISHTTDEKVKEAEGKISHTTDEKVKEAEGKIYHTTDEKVKEAEGKISHTTDEKVKEAEGKISHTTDEKVKEAEGKISHTTDEKVKEAEGKISHTTDEKVKEAEGKISHTTDEKVKEAEGKISHTTDEKVKEAEGKISHTTDEKVKEAVKNISHTTDEKVKEAEGKISHTTDEKVKEAEGKISHTTDEKVKEAEGKLSHTTDEKVKEAEGKISHTTEEKLKEAEGKLSHTAYEKVKEAEGKISHTTDEKVKEAEGKISHTTDEKVKEAEGKISHTTDEKVKEAEGKISHTTDEKVKEAEGKISHTTDEKVKEAEGKISHTTDEKVKEAEGKISHTTDEKVKEAEGKIFHTTDEKVKEAEGKLSHTTDKKVKEAEGKISHTTDEKVKEAEGKISHTTDEKVKEAEGKISHTTDEKVKEAEGKISHTTDEKVKEAEGKISHTTDETVKEAEGKISHTTEEKVKEAEGKISEHADKCMTKNQEDIGELVNKANHAVCSKTAFAVTHINQEGLAVGENIKDLGGRVREDIRDEASAAGRDITHQSREVLTNIKGLEREVRDYVRDEAAAAGRDITHQAREVLTNVKDEGSNAIEDIREETASAGTDLVHLGQELKGNLKDEGSKAIEDIREETASAGTDLVHLGQELKGNLKDEGSKAIEDIREETASAGTDLVHLGQELTGNLKGVQEEARKAVQDETASGVSQIQRVVEDGTSKIKDLQESNPKRSLDKYLRLKKEYRRILIQYYKKERCVVRMTPVKAQFDDDVSKIFAQPKLVYHTKQAVGVQGHNKGAPVTNYKDIFYKDGKELQNIFILGEAGMGKSTFCSHLTSVWCDVMHESDNNPAERRTQTDVSTSSVNKTPRECQHQNRSTSNTVFSDTEILNQFDFVFPVLLRKAKQDTDLDSLIFQQVIDKVDCSTEHDHEFIRRIMFEEKCLIVIDGLDEWPHSIRHRKFRNNWTYLTTTRPWKMADIQLQDSKIDIELSIEGITDPEDFIDRAFLSLNEKHAEKTGTRMEKQPMEFIEEIHTRNLDQFLEVPVVLMQLISVWFNTGEFGNSKCVIYASNMEMMLKRTIIDKPNFQCEVKSTEQEKKIDLPKCFSRYRTKVCMNNRSFILNLAKLAFYTLTQEDQSSSVVFDGEVVDQHLSDTERRMALDIGIMSECEVISYEEERSTFNFLHKTFQEFLCAVFIATRNSEDRHCCMTRLFSIFGKCVPILDVSEIFIFACGMSPDAGKHMSDKVNEAMTDYIAKNISTFHSFGGMVVNRYQKMISEGFTECVNNGHGDPRLHLGHMILGSYSQNTSIIQNLLEVNAGRILSMHGKNVSMEKLMDVLDNNSNIKLVSLVNIEETLPDTTLDMSSCKRLEHLQLSDRTSPNIKINATNLISCNLRKIPESSVRDILTALASGAHRLQKLTIGQHRDYAHSMRPLCKYRFPDLHQVLPTLTGLKEVELGNIDIGDSEIHFPASVRKIELHKIGPSSGVIDMSACDKLGKLECTNVEIRHIKINPCNLTSCELNDVSESSVRDILTTLAPGAHKLQKLTIGQHRGHKLFMLLTTSKCKYRFPDLYQVLPTLTSLEEVELGDIDIGDSEIHFPASVRKVTLLDITLSLRSWTCMVDTLVSLPQSVKCKIVWSAVKERNVYEELTNYVKMHSGCEHLPLEKPWIRFSHKDACLLIFRTR